VRREARSIYNKQKPCDTRFNITETDRKKQSGKTNSVSPIKEICKIVGY